MYHTICGLFVCLLLSAVSVSAAELRTLTGTIVVLAVDYDTHEVGEEVTFEHFLRLESGDRYRLDLSHVQNHTFRTGEEYTLVGQLVEHQESRRLLIVHRFNLHSKVEPRLGSLAAASPRRILTVFVNFNDAPAPCSVDEVKATLWTATTGVVDFYEKVALGKIDYMPDTVGEASGDFVTVSIDYSKDGVCEPNDIGDLADTAVKASGVDANAYTNILYIIPYMTACGWSGVGVFGCAGEFQCQLYANNCSVSTIAHELGHNEGMLHASKDLDNDGVIDPLTEYGDPSDIMGAGTTVKFFNGAHMKQIGLIDESETRYIYNGSGTFEINPVSAPRTEGANASPKLVSFPVLGQSQGNNYYVSFRVPAGSIEKVTNPDSYFDAERNIVNKIFLHKSQFSGTFFGNTLLVKQFDVGDSYTDPHSGATVSYLANNTTSATVKVELSKALPTPTPTPAPTPTPDPGSGGDSGGGFDPGNDFGDPGTDNPGAEDPNGGDPSENPGDGDQFEDEPWTYTGSFIVSGSSKPPKRGFLKKVRVLLKKPGVRRAQKFRASADGTFELSVDGTDVDQGAFVKVSRKLLRRYKYKLSKVVLSSVSDGQLVMELGRKRR